MPSTQVARLDAQALGRGLCFASFRTTHPNCFECHQRSERGFQGRRVRLQRCCSSNTARPSRFHEDQAARRRASFPPGLACCNGNFQSTLLSPWRLTATQAWSCSARARSRLLSTHQSLSFYCTSHRNCAPQHKSNKVECGLTRFASYPCSYL